MVSPQELEDALVQAADTEFIYNKVGGGFPLRAIGERFFQSAAIARFPELERRDVERIVQNALVRLVKAGRMVPAGINGWSTDPTAICEVSWRNNCLAREEREVR